MGDVVSDRLLVPIKLDALVLSAPRALRGPTFDFAAVSGSEGPFVAGRGTTAAFSDAGFLARRGIHLHWALPDILTRGRNGGGGPDSAARLAMPTAPDRWLVLRAGQPLCVVESDWTDPAGSGVAYPDFATDGASGIDSLAVTRLGRTLPAQGWAEPTATDRHLNKRATGPDAHRLTALGWGEPLFAAYYPNCHSVFGCLDAPLDQAASLPNATTDLRYDVIGWHARPDQDLLADGQAALVDALARAAKRAPADDADRQWRAALADLGLSVPDGLARRRATVYVGSITIPRGRDDAPPRPDASRMSIAVKVAFGETGAEALVAALSDGTGLDGALLSAAAVGGQVDTDHPDALLAVQEALHTAGFAPHPGGTVWHATKTDATQTPDPKNVPLPNDLAQRLATLNDLQRSLDRATAESQTRQEACYSDWVLSQLALFPPPDSSVAYPDAVLAEALVQDVDLPLLRACQARQQAALAARDACRTDLAARLAALVPSLSLRAVPAPRHYAPRDPVILLEGAVLAPGDRHDSGIAPMTLPVTLPPHWWTDAASLARLTTATALPRPALPPLFLEWEAECQPAATSLATDHLPSDAISAGWTLGDTAEAGADLIQRTTTAPDRFVALTDARVTGVSLLMPHAATAMAQSVAAALLARARTDSLPDRGTLTALAASGLPAFAALSDAVAQVAPTSALHRAWVAAAGWTLPGGGAAPKPSRSGDTVFAKLQMAIEQLTGPTAPPRQLQTLGGFNDALVGRLRGYQLPIACPAGPPASRDLAAQVAAAVGPGQRPAPLPLATFQPLRSGRMRLTRLRLIDSFGCKQDIATPTPDLLPVALSPRMAARPGSQAAGGWVGLTPRLLHPARLALQFLGSDRADLSGLGTRVAGWLLAVTLDHAVQVSAADGTALGRIAPAPDGQRVMWQPLPGTDAPTPEAIVDPTLRRVVRWLMARDAAFLSAFLTGLGEAAARIDPAEARAHDAQAMLYGRPFVLMRAEVGIELSGLPQGDLSWDGLRRRLRRLTLAGTVLRDHLLPARGMCDQAKTRTTPAALDPALTNIATHLAAARPALVETLPPALMSLVPPIIDGLNDAVKGARLGPRTSALATASDLLDRLFTALAEVFSAASLRTAGVADLTVPVRLGEYEKLEDGLVGYWTEGIGGDLGQTFYGSQMTQASVPGLVSHADGVVTLPCRLSDPPQHITLLMDPMASLHASCGLLPTTAIRLDSSDYQTALHRLEVYLQLDAVLTDPAAPRLPLPRAPGFVPQLMVNGRAGGAWQVLGGLQDLSATPSLSPGLQLLDGWLRLVPAEDDPTTEPQR